MSDPHKDVDVEDHVRTMMNNTGRSKRNAARLEEVEAKQDEVRESLIPKLSERVGGTERVCEALKNVPEQLAKSNANNMATRWFLATLLVLVGVVLGVLNAYAGGAG